METEKIRVTNFLHENDEKTIKKGLLKINGIISVIIIPEFKQVEVMYEQIERTKIVHRLFALGYYEDQTESSLLGKTDSYPILLL